MKIIQSPRKLQQDILVLKRQGKTIGFVPTMGNLHQGHLSLIEIAKEKADIIICSIFINPMQFGAGEDLEGYPRTMKSDLKKLGSLNIDYLFTPTNKDIYPKGKEVHTSVEIHRLTDKLCGASRPGHFRGVTTVVNILFNIVQPDIAVFGKKDYQQYQIIKAMTRDLRLPIKIIGGEIIREKNGLAMSSRNGYLTAKEKEQASFLRKIVLDSDNKIQQKIPFRQIIEEAIVSMREHGFKVDYFDILRQSDLQDAMPSDKELLIAAAGWLGKPKLLDNQEVFIK